MNQQTISIPEQLACVEREIKMRERVYPRCVADKRMTQAKADHELAAMRAVRETLAGTFSVSTTLTVAAADVPHP